MAAKAILSRFGLELRFSDIRQYPESTDQERELIERFNSYSMTTPYRQWTLLKALDYVQKAGIQGDIVECGVWRGGNMLLAKAFLGNQRQFWLYDTFAGMAEPTEDDVSIDGRSAREIHSTKQQDDHNKWAYASLEEVTENFRKFNLLDDNLVFRKGMVEETLNTNQLPDKISVLRLDTDWYESTLIELKVLYPRLQHGGVLIIDDYGSWLGSRKAVDEYFDGRPPLLTPVDRACRMAIKI
jgi:hypothetical protein